MFGILAGYKTYIVAGLAALGTIASVLTGDMTWQQAVPSLITAITSATMRSAIANKK